MKTYTVSRRGLVDRIVQVTDKQYVIYYCDRPLANEPVCFDGRHFIGATRGLADHMRMWRADGCTIQEGW